MLFPPVPCSSNHHIACLRIFDKELLQFSQIIIIKSKCKPSFCERWRFYKFSSHLILYKIPYKIGACQRYSLNTSQSIYRYDIISLGVEATVDADEQVIRFA